MKHHTLIIAEAGVNHNGSLELALQLIDAAVDAGADIVKFQTFKADKIASKSAAMADYQKQAMGGADSQLEMLRRLELSKEDHDKLIAHCREKKIAFLSTPFDTESIELLQNKGITIGKVPSGEITNRPFLEAMAQSFPRIILSTGMATMAEVQDAVQLFIAAGVRKENLIVLHCNTEYPTPMKDVNLLAMNYLREALDVGVGYSDHTLGIEVPVAAVALGATVIEKHFTLDRNMEGPDHKASLEPAELKAMVAAIRNIEWAVSGSGVKEPSASELKNIAVARKSLIAAKQMPVGHVIRKDDLLVKRPGTGISPMRIHEIIGKTLTRALMPDEVITDEHFGK